MRYNVYRQEHVSMQSLDSVGVLFPNQYLFLKNKSRTIVKRQGKMPMDCHWKNQYLISGRPRTRNLTIIPCLLLISLLVVLIIITVSGNANTLE